MFQRHGVILKSHMKIRLTGMPRVWRLCKETQIRYPQSIHQHFFFRDAIVVGLCGENRMNKEAKKQDQAIEGDVDQV